MLGGMARALKSLIFLMASLLAAFAVYGGRGILMRFWLRKGYALGLERSLRKGLILALWLDALEMGRGPDGWMIGFSMRVRRCSGHLRRRWPRRSFSG
ncbi:hypothetical protein CLN94_11020 [Pseudothioclava arenosa]|uniref:Uncharacterized protein n=1 Tax=Pseudothioclava arenosa TaxID=1795308 RepID=A0A2A4CPJ0_9RHOB|nr:hypothetical protein CLN94_11020 [Pseudothioclava arenosa]